MPSKFSDVLNRVCDLWYNVPPTAIVNLYKPMQRRIAAVLTAKCGAIDIGCDAFKHVSLQCLLIIQLINQMRWRNISIQKLYKMCLVTCNV